MPRVLPRIHGHDADVEDNDEIALVGIDVPLTIGKAKRRAGRPRKHPDGAAQSRPVDSEVGAQHQNPVIPPAPSESAMHISVAPPRGKVILPKKTIDKMTGSYMECNRSGFQSLPFRSQLQDVIATVKSMPRSIMSESALRVCDGRSILIACR